MKNNYIKKLTTLLGFCSLNLFLTLSPVNTLNVYAATNPSNIAQPYSNVTIWRYKIENQKLYKRLYDSSTRRWVGNWIYVCDYPT